MTKTLAELMKRVERWPRSAQRELIELAEAIDQELRAGPPYRATPEELAAIDEADRSPSATEEEVEEAFAKFRGG